jgi:hypothetical protein
MALPKTGQSFEHPAPNLESRSRVSVSVRSVGEGWGACESEWESCIEKESALRGADAETIKGENAIVNKLLLLAAVSVLTLHAAYPQSQVKNKQLKTGEMVQLSDGLTARVMKSAPAPFAKVKVKGEAVVVVLELDAGKKGVTLSYRLTADPKLSDVYLAGGTQRIAPRAVIEDFPSWGNDNDKDVEVLDPTDKSGRVTLTFERKGSVTLLFDVPMEQAKTPQTFSMMLRTVKPKDEQLSLVVNL